MKKLGKMLRKSIVFCFVMIVICAFIYPFALTGISQLTMKNKANGNLIDKNGEPISNAEEAVGSELIGQDFTEDYFFHGRVSAVNYNTYTEEQKENGEYSGVASGGSNYGNSNPELEKRMEKDLETFLKEYPDVKIFRLTYLQLPVPDWIHISARKQRKFKLKQLQKILDYQKKKSKKS